MRFESRCWSQRRWGQVLCVVVTVALPSIASADVVINDLTENPITAVVADSLNPGDNGTITANKDTPEKVGFSISVDGTGGGSGVALMLEKAGGPISDILQVTATQKTRGMGIKYLDISGTFTSDTDSQPEGLNELFAGLGLPEAIAKKVMDAAVIENGKEQSLSAALINTETGNELNLFTSIKAASDVPEPSTLMPLGFILGILARRCRSRAARVGLG